MGDLKDMAEVVVLGLYAPALLAGLWLLREWWRDNRAGVPPYSTLLTTIGLSVGYPRLDRRPLQAERDVQDVPAGIAVVWPATHLAGLLFTPLQLPDSRRRPIRRRSSVAP